MHDLGGPIGLYWASQHPERLSKLALLNTLVYAQPSWAVIAFVAACKLLLRSLLVSPGGLKLAMRIGVADPAVLTDEVMRGVLAPFESATRGARCSRPGTGFTREGFGEIERWLPTMRVPVRIVYGERDRILPDVAKTMRRVARDVPHAETTALGDCGHFLQEDRPPRSAPSAEFLNR